VREIADHVLHDLVGLLVQLKGGEPVGRLDDNAHVLVRWTGGARGTILASQTSPGHYNDLSIRIYGDKAGLEWLAHEPEVMRFTPFGEPTRTLVRGGPGLGAASAPAPAGPDDVPMLRRGRS